MMLSLILTVLMVVPMMLIGGVLFSMTFLFTSHAALMLSWLFIAAVVSGLAALAIAIPMPALVLNYVVSQNISSLWNLRDALDVMKRSVGDYALIAGLPVGAAVLSGMVSTTGIGAILTIPLFALTWIVQARMLGEYHRTFCQ